MHYEAAITSQPLTLNRSASRVPFRKILGVFFKIFALKKHLTNHRFSGKFSRFFRKISDAFFAKFPHFKTPYKSSISGEIFAKVPCI